MSKNAVPLLILCYVSATPLLKLCHISATVAEEMPFQSGGTTEAHRIHKGLSRNVPESLSQSHYKDTKFSGDMQANTTRFQFLRQDA